MTNKTMAREVGLVLLYLLMTCVFYSLGLHFEMVRTPEGVYCGHLQCLTDINQTNSNTLSITGLTIFDVTKESIKLASLSVFVPHLYVEPTKIHVLNATGSVSRYSADLSLSFRAETDCRNGSFMCELDFVNVSGLPEVIKEVVTPGSSGDSPTIVNQLSEMAMQIKTLSNDTGRQLTELRTDMENMFNRQLTEQRTDMENMFNRQLTEQRTDMENMFNRQLTELKAYMEYMFNNSLEEQVQNSTQKSCVKGMASSCRRQNFLLWGKIEALCDTETDGGGWVVIQRRTKGDVDFYRGWNDYKNGFGTPDTDFWIGNDIIHNLTSQGYTDLRIDLEYGGAQHFAHYSNFRISDEQSNYRITFGEYNGTSEDFLTYHKGSSFSTRDRDNDNAAGSHGDNCATLFHGAWWYFDCYSSNLNGKWGVHDLEGVTLYIGSKYYYPTFTEMKIRTV